MQDPETDDNSLVKAAGGDGFAPPDTAGTLDLKYRLGAGKSPDEIKKITEAVDKVRNILQMQSASGEEEPPPAVAAGLSTADVQTVARMENGHKQPECVGNEPPFLSGSKVYIPRINGVQEVAEYGEDFTVSPQATGSHALSRAGGVVVL